MGKIGHDKLRKATADEGYVYILQCLYKGKTRKYVTYDWNGRMHI